MRALGKAGPVVVVVCCAVLLLGWWTKARCLGDGGWENTEQYFRWCYTDVLPLWTAERLSEGAVPYLDHPVEYPVLTGAQMWLAAQVADLFDPGRRGLVFFHVTALLNAGLCLAVLGLLASAGLPARRLLWWAAAPTLALYMVLNWDPLAIVLLTAAVVAHLQGRDAAAGVAAGLGVAAKLFPGIVLPLFVAARWKQGRRREALTTLGAGAAAWLVVNLPVAVAAPDGWREFFTFNRERGANFDSLWLLLQRAAHLDLSVGALNALSTLAFLGGAAAIVGIGVRRRDAGDWWALGLPLLCWFLVTNKVYSPQYSLWLLPLAALTLRRFAPFVAFVIADAFVFVVEFPFLAGVGGEALAPGYDVLAVALVVRAGVLVWMAVESTLDHDPLLTAAATPPARAATARSPAVEIA